MSLNLINGTDHHDNCGFGLMTHLHGKVSHQLLLDSIGALSCMTHRGGVAADGETGDGCGLLMSMPREFIRQEAKQLGIHVGDMFGVGACFLPVDAEARQHAKDVVEAIAVQNNVKVLGWREVPTDSSVCGPIALASMPAIEQCILEPTERLSQIAFNRALFWIHRLAQKQLEGDPYFYIASMSCSVLVYKGLMLPQDLPKFYSDLSNPDVKVSICVFHQRFSTNTQPEWRLAQPFRYLAHNGEINTISGNRTWARARIKHYENEHLTNLERIAPIVNQDGSDSSCLDNMLEVLLMGGMNLCRALRMLIPPAWQNIENIDPQLKAFYEYNAMHMEPWDGPAGIVLSDGRYAACLLDRNGLRPARWLRTHSDILIVASETGVHPVDAIDIHSKGRIGPGEMLIVDTETGEFLESGELDRRMKTRYPYGRWLRSHTQRITTALGEETIFSRDIAGDELDTYLKRFHVTNEELQEIIRPMAETGQEAVGSMGDDTPMAVLSRTIRPVTDYFRQKFAQVTNPPIDPLREAIVMSLETCLGPEHGVFNEASSQADRATLSNPILSRSKFHKVIHLNPDVFSVKLLTLGFSKTTSLEQAIRNLREDAHKAVMDGYVILHLSDRHFSSEERLIPASMAVGAVHHYLSDLGLRCRTNILIETGCARDSHQMAVLIGLGATAIYPYLAYEIIADLVQREHLLGDSIALQKSYRKATKKGLLKILSKMGISAVASYRGAQLFEAVGLADEIMELCFKGMVSRIQGATFKDFELEIDRLASLANNARKPVPQGGVLKYIHGGEYHANNPDVVHALHRAVNSGNYEAYKEYAGIVQDRPVAMLRDLLSIQYPKNGIELEAVEPANAILKRFDSAGMSLGALSPEAHEAIAIAMNRLGGRSNSGEGGEDPSRYNSDRVSKIKQIASGRFGVTAEYLMSAEVLQIKIAQGAKPGEGGQLPGGKVNSLIARLRFSVPGVTLISPPPHHDIYSIEDLAQLIFDLKQVNPKALVSVKLVSEPGIGTIAVGVAKAFADLITVSGYDGGTAASPLSSIHHAGSPWELGLAEVHQTLRANGLRDRVRVQVDGGLKTGIDVIKAAMLGAESFGFGTIPMLALGCKFLRICHLNNCATGVATQQPDLREEYFLGAPEKVMHFFQFVAQDVREILADLGMSSLESVVGRSDLLTVLEGYTPKHRQLDLSAIVASDYVDVSVPQTCQVEKNAPSDQGELAENMVKALLPMIEGKLGGALEYSITNCDRSIGARVAGEIALRHGNQGMAGSPIEVKFHGVAGQSFGVWNVGGLHLKLIGDANDYVGKGMTGGQITIMPPSNAGFVARETPIVGNTCLYGATGGRLMAAGRAGERFAVRNSGALAIVEGAGDHCCEYMTGGVVIVLGRTGVNFGAGMTGGFAFVFDEDGQFSDKYNRELVQLARIVQESMESWRLYLFNKIEEFYQETQSVWAKELLESFDEYAAKFWLVTPKAADAGALLQYFRDDAA